MGLFDTMASVIAELDRAGIPHMVSGSVASAHHGESRATQDIDVVIDPTASQLHELVEALRARGLYVDDAAAAMAHRSQFNAIDTTTGWKVDLIIKKDRAYSREEFARRRPAELGGLDVYVTSPEDSILSKLEWGAASGSERQVRDVQSIIRAQLDRLDWSYLEHWAGELHISELLEQARTAS